MPKNIFRASSRFWVPALVFVVTVGVFWPTLHNRFLNWDDNILYLGNEGYRGLGRQNIGWMFSDSFKLVDYVPLHWMLMGLVYCFSGMNPVGYHIAAVAFHALNAVLAYFLILKILRLSLPHPTLTLPSPLRERVEFKNPLPYPRPEGTGWNSRTLFHTLALKGEGRVRVEGGIPWRLGSAFGALFFSLHPLRVEAVAWMTVQNYVPACTLYLASVGAYLRAFSFPGNRRRRVWMGVSWLCFASALLTKPTVMTLPAALVVLDVLCLNRLPRRIGRWADRENIPVLLEKIPFLLLSALDGAATFASRLYSGVVVPWSRYGFRERLAQAIWNVYFYASRTFFPLGLSPYYQAPMPIHLLRRPFPAAGIFVAAACFVLVFFRKRWAAAGWVWAFYLAALLPTSGIFQCGSQLGADRYSYISCLGWAVLIAAAAARYLETGSFLYKGVKTACLGLVVLGLGTLTQDRIRMWRDDKSLWEAVLAAEPENPVAHLNLAHALIEEGSFNEAIPHLNLVSRLFPEKARYNLGLALAGLGERGQARREFRQVLRINPRNGRAHLALEAVDGRGGVSAPAPEFKPPASSGRRPALSRGLARFLISIFPFPEDDFGSDK